MTYRQIYRARAYLNSLRAPLKRSYAEAYYTWLCRHGVVDPGPEPDRPAKLSAMAAQAVRLTLHEFRARKGTST